MMKYQVACAEHKFEVFSSSRMDAALLFIGRIQETRQGPISLAAVILVRELPEGQAAVVCTTKVLEHLGMEYDPIHLRLCR
jgi:hypothetical protein